MKSCEWNGVSNNQQLGCLFNGFLRPRAEISPNVRINGLLWREYIGHRPLQNETVIDKAVFMDSMLKIGGTVVVNVRMTVF